MPISSDPPELSSNAGWRPDGNTTRRSGASRVHTTNVYTTRNEGSGTSVCLDIGVPPPTRETARQPGAPQMRRSRACGRRTAARFPHPESGMSPGPHPRGGRFAAECRLGAVSHRAVPELYRSLRSRRFHRRTPPFESPERAHRACESHSTERTSPLCPSRVFRQRDVSTSQTRTEPSLEPESA